MTLSHTQVVVFSLILVGHFKATVHEEKRTNFLFSNQDTGLSTMHDVDGNLIFGLSPCPFVPAIIAIKGTEKEYLQCRRKGYKSEALLAPENERNYICISRNPIELFPESKDASPPRSLEIGRLIMNSMIPTNDAFDDSRSCFYIKFSVQILAESKTAFWCSTLDRNHKFGQNIGFREHRSIRDRINKSQQVQVDLTRLEGNVSLPCRCPVNSTTRLDKDSKVFNPGTAITYVENVGFVFNLSSMTEPYGEYRCESSEVDFVPVFQRYSVSVNYNYLNVVRPEFRVSPPGNEIVIIRAKNVSIHCSSFSPIGMGLFVDAELKEPFTSISQTNSSLELEPQFEYNLSFELDDKYLTRQYNIYRKDASISCFNSQTMSIYHKWIIKRSTDGIYFDPVQRAFFCGSEITCKDEFGFLNCPRIYILSCANPIHCNMLRSSCFHRRNNIIFHWKIFRDTSDVVTMEKSECVDASLSNNPALGARRHKSNCTNVTIQAFLVPETIACARADAGFAYPAGLVHCTSTLYDDWLYFFKGISSSDGESPEIILDWRGVPQEHYLQLSLTEMDSNRTYFLSESIVLKCTYSTYLFGHGLQWRVQMNNGSIKFIKHHTAGTSSTNPGGSNIGYAAETTKIYLHDTNIKAIICFAPLWNSTEWLNASVYVQVAAPLKLWQVLVATGTTLFALILFGVACAFVWKFYQKKKVIREFRDGTGRVNVQINAEGLNKARQVPFDPADEIKSTELVIGPLIGEGNFGLVHKAKFTKEGAAAIPVAVKSIKNPSIVGLNSMILEYQIMKYVTNHENVLRLLGVVQEDIDNYNIKLVVEFCIHGSLYDYLISSIDTFINLINSDNEMALVLAQSESKSCGPGYVDWDSPTNTIDLLKWSLQICSGLKHLEALKIVHSDISTRNILLNEIKTAKIGDFGLSEKLPDSRTYVRQQKTFAWRWASPETQHYLKFSTNADIWSFGITLWEIFSLGQSPYNDLNSRPNNFDNRRVEEHPMTVLNKPNYATQEIYNIIKECWKVNPEERISLNDLQIFFKNILNIE